MDTQIYVATWTEFSYHTLTSNVICDALEHPNCPHRAGRYDVQPTGDLHLPGQAARSLQEHVGTSPMILHHLIYSRSFGPRGRIQFESTTPTFKCLHIWVYM